jgi:hypothetical protein
VLRPEETPYLEFQAMARAMLAEAQGNRELLGKHGLVDTVLEGMVKKVKLLDHAIELDAIGELIIHLTNVTDGLNRDRFADA